MDAKKRKNLWNRMGAGKRPNLGRIETFFSQRSQKVEFTVSWSYSYSCSLAVLIKTQSR